MTAAEILDLLRERHPLDIWVSECKTGSTWMGQHRRLDAWTCRASWSAPLFTGYEVKVSRADWRADTKWTDYLAVCERLYLVCPARLIGVDEVDPRLGLIWANGAKLSTRRAAPRRPVDRDALCDLLLYVMFNRARITARPQVGHAGERWRTPTLDEWRAWLAERRETHAIGQLIGNRISDALTRARDAENSARVGLRRLLIAHGLLDRMSTDDPMRVLDKHLERACQVSP